MAWNKLLPLDDSLLINTPGYLRANWAAIELGTDAALLITNAKVASDAGIVDSKLAQITTASKVSGAAITLLPNVPSGAGYLPLANLGSGTPNSTKVLSGGQAWVQVDLTTMVTGTLPVGNGGTGATAAANAANGVVVLNASSQMPAVSGALLTNLPSGITQVNDTDAGTTFDNDPVVTFLSVAKTITSGNTVLLIASGYIHAPSSKNGGATITLKQGATTVQSVITYVNSGTTSDDAAFSLCGIVTGLSGNITFTVTAESSRTDTLTAYGNLVVLEF